MLEAILAAGLGAGMSLAIAGARARGARARAGRAARAEAAARRAAREASALAAGGALILAAREEALETLAAFDAEAAARERVLDAAERRCGEAERALGPTSGGGLESLVALQARAELLADAERRGHVDVAAARQATRLALERAVGVSGDALRIAGVAEALTQARAAAADGLRRLEAQAGDPESVRRAKRLMGIAVGRFAGHYLTERLPGVVALPPPPAAEVVIGPGEANLRAIEAVANVKLLLSEARDAVRLEGQDGVGREVARRCLHWLGRRPRASGPEAARAFRDTAARLGHEIVTLGRRAFDELKIARAHPDIVRLVGALNYRTSYTQNQWKHAVEAALLCGLMAEELGLDHKLARRAALEHDIGKALTHELDGSHAVIGADYARRLGEPEVVANAIGAHHTDEPFNSPYALLVAAADAMSGARPGARRQSEDTFVAKVGELERLGRAFPGVADAFAVQGGRELRIIVDERTVDDLGAVALAGEVARRVSHELTFPGQIKVTVIRELVAAEIAG